MTEIRYWPIDSSNPGTKKNNLQSTVNDYNKSFDAEMYQLLTGMDNDPMFDMFGKVHQ